MSDIKNEKDTYVIEQKSSNEGVSYSIFYFLNRTNAFPSYRKSTM